MSDETAVIVTFFHSKPIDLCKRAISETIINQLKNISWIAHSRHCSPINFLVNLSCGFIAY